jgi:hypothetical protein
LLACPLLSACCCWRLIFADLWGEFSTHLSQQALFTQSSPVREPLLQAFPFASTGGGDSAPTFSGLRVCLQLTWEVGLLPSPVEFSSLLRAHKLSCSWLLGTRPCSRPLRPGPACLVTVPGGIPLPPLWSSGCPTLFATCLYCSDCLLLSFSFFPGGGSVCPGAMLLWPRVVCRCTMYRLAHLVHIFPSCLGTHVWQPRGPPGFSI